MNTFFFYLGENTSFLYERTGATIQLISTGSTRTPSQFHVPPQKATSPLWIITNLSSETYEIQQLPTLKKREQTLLVQQKLQKIFTKQHYCAAVSLQAPVFKFWQRSAPQTKQPYLFSSLMADELVQQWVDFFAAQQWMVMGVSTFALLLATELKKILALHQKACCCFRTPDDLLNMLYCYQGQLYFSRKISMPSDEAQLTYEIQRTVQFVTNQYPILQQDQAAQFDLYLLQPKTIRPISPTADIRALLLEHPFSLEQFFCLLSVKNQPVQFAPESLLPFKQKIFRQKRLYLWLIIMTLSLGLLNGGLFYTWQQLQAEQTLITTKIMAQQNQFTAYQATLPVLPAGYSSSMIIQQAHLFDHIQLLENSHLDPLKMLYQFSHLFGQFKNQMHLKSLTWERPTSHTPKARLRFTAERLAMAATLETETHAILNLMSTFESTAKQMHLGVKTEKLPLDLHSRAELIQDTPLDFNKLRKKRLFTVSLTDENH